MKDRVVSVESAVQNGREQARALRARWGTEDPFELAAHCRVRIIEREEPAGHGIFCLSEYQASPPTIYLNRPTLQMAQSALEGTGAADVEQFAVAHELYHHLEYTESGNRPPHHHETAARAFAEELTGAEFPEVALQKALRARAERKGGA